MASINLGNQEQLQHTQLLALIDYDASTGSFTWKPRSGCPSGGGKTAGRRLNNGYISICVNHKPFLAHRLAWFYVHAEWPTNTVDHIDRDRSNNRLSNLRLATTDQNGSNRLSFQNKTGYAGVHWNKERPTRPFACRVKVRGKSVYIGCFATPLEAHEAYIKAKRELHEFFEL